MGFLRKEEGAGMQSKIILEEGGKPIRFTPDGKVAVKDAVKALTGSEHWPVLWNKTVSENPHILQYCERYAFEDEIDQLVADSEGWERITMLLLESMADLDSSGPGEKRRVAE